MRCQLKANSPQVERLLMLLTSDREQLPLLNVMFFDEYKIFSMNIKYSWIKLIWYICIEPGDSYDQNGKLLFKNQISTFIVGAGNFNGKTTASDKVKPAIPAPNRPCDSSIKYTTSIDQAALYRYLIFKMLTINALLERWLLLGYRVTLIRCILIQNLQS